MSKRIGFALAKCRKCGTSYNYYNYKCPSCGCPVGWTDKMEKDLQELIRKHKK